MKLEVKHMLSRKRLFRYASYTCVSLLSIYALCFICPPVQDNNSHAITGTSVASDTTLSISLSGSELPLDITPTSSNGTFASTADDDTGSSTAVIHVATNNITGYTLGIKASNPASSSADKLISNNTKCENTPTSNKCAISSLPQPVSSEDYIDNTVEGIDLNNTWGYAPSKYNSTSNIDSTTGDIVSYYPAPVQGDVIATTSAPNQENTNTNDGTLVSDEYTIDYGMRIDYSPYFGTYSTNYNNQSYIITAVGNPVPYSVSYNANIPTGIIEEVEVTNIPTAQTGNVQGGDTVAVILSTKVPTLGSTNPSTGEYEYAGYVFTGWCTVQPQEDQTTGYQTCPNDATLYQPGDDFGIDQTVENAQILYAVWGAPATVIFNSNGLTYSDTAIAAENIMTFIPTYADGEVTGNKVNVVDSGTYRTPILTTPDNYIFKGWSTDQNATEATYQNEQAIINDLTLNAYDEITLYAIWSYTTVITFDGNGADGGTMEPFVIEAGKTEALPQNTFTKESYVFNGWNTIATPTEQDPGGAYADEADYTAEAGSHNVMLYAQWKKLPAIGDLTYMQDFATLPEGDKISVLNSMAEEEQYQLKDNRDQKKYYISKLKDGNVWMTQNLDLCLGCDGTTPLTSQNTDLNEFKSGVYYDGYTSTNGVIKWTPSYGARTSDHIVDGSSASGWTNVLYEPRSAEGKDVYIYPTTSASSDIVYDSLVGCIDDGHTASSCTHYQIGNFYNWSAAIASNWSSGIQSRYEIAGNSICPSGWRLPKGKASATDTASTREFGELLRASGVVPNLTSSSYTSNGFNLIRNPNLYLTMAGGIYGSGAYRNQGLSGTYLSSINADDDSNYVLGFTANNVSSGGYNDHDYGFSIRCLVRQ